MALLLLTVSSVHLGDKFALPFAGAYAPPVNLLDIVCASGPYCCSIRDSSASFPSTVFSANT